MIILGIDPGTSRIGYGLLEKKEELQLLKSGIIEITEKDPYKKLLILAKELEKIIKKYKPSRASIEKLYFSKNQKTGISVAESIGLIKYIILKNKIPIREYTPLQIKSAVTGYGNASKSSVSKMSSLILKIDKIEGPDDISDAIAIAITAAHDNS